MRAGSCSNPKNAGTFLFALLIELNSTRSPHQSDVERGHVPHSHQYTASMSLCYGTFTGNQCSSPNAHRRGSF